MKKILLFLTIFLSVFLGTTACVVVDGYYKYQANKEDVSTVSSTGPDNSVLTSLASNVLGLSQFGGDFTLTNDETINLSGTFAIENKDTQIVDLNISGYCASFYVDANVQYSNNTIYINFNNNKLKLTTSDIESAINILSETIESESASELPELNTDLLMGFLDKIKITETATGQLIELAIPDLCNLYLTTNKDSLPTQILINNINVGENTFTLNVNCNQTQKVTDIDESDYISISPVLDYIKPTLLALNENNLSISGQVIVNNQAIFINTIIKNKSSISGTITFNNIEIKYQLKNDYILIELFSKVFKITIDDIDLLLNTLSSSVTTTKNSNTNYNIEEELNRPTITPTITNDILSAIELQSDSIYGSFDISKSYFNAISISENNTKSIKELINLLNNYKSIISNEYSMDINYKQDDINISGSLYISHDNFNIQETYFNGKISNIPVQIFYKDSFAYCNINDLKFKMSSQSIENVIGIITKYITGTSNTIDTSILSNLTFIDNIDFNGRTITYNNNGTTAHITSYSGFFKANITAGSAQINATIYTDGTYKYLSKKLIPNEYKNYSEVSNLLSATINSLNENIIEYSGNICVDMFNTTIKTVGLNVKIDKNQKQIDIKLSNLPNNAILTYLSSIYYDGQDCHITITENYVKIYTTTRVRLTGRTVVLANKVIPLNEFSVNNLQDIMTLRKIYINQVTKESSNNPKPQVEFSTDMLDINKDEIILTLTKFVETFASELKVEIKHKNTIENITGILNIHDVIKFKLYLNKIN